VITFVTTAFWLQSTLRAEGEKSLDLEAIVAGGSKYTWVNLRKLTGPWSEPGGKRIFLAGDSQGADVANLLVEFDPDVKKSLRTFSSDKFCQIKYDPGFYTSGDYRDIYTAPANQIAKCAQDGERFRADRRVEDADVIILAYAWYASALKYLENEITEIRKRNPRARIFVAGRKDQPKSSVEYLQEGFKTADAERAAAGNYRPDVRNINRQLASLAGAELLDVYRVLCASNCKLFTETGYPLLFDVRHLTPIGARYVAGSRSFWLNVANPMGLSAPALP
jgi:hypothetical protein